jgi:hypothetical protein
LIIGTAWNASLGFTTKPDLLTRTTDPLFVKVMLDLTIAMDMTRREFSMKLCHWVDGMDNDWARKIHPVMYSKWDGTPLH